MKLDGMNFTAVDQAIYGGRRNMNSSHSLAVVTLIFGLIVFCAGTVHAAAGDLDQTFGAGGKVTNSYGTSADRAYAVLVRNTGKIIVVGNVNTSLGRVGIVRYNPDGSLDTTFGANGKIAAYFEAGPIHPHQAVVQSDGKIVVVGTASLATGGTFAVARFNLDGSVDASFSSDGYVQAEFEELVSAESYVDLTIQSDGKILVAGTIWKGGIYKMGLARFNSDGSPDSSFWAGGTKIYEESSDQLYAHAVAVDGNGRIHVAGRRVSGPNSYGVVRIFDSYGYLLTNHNFNWSNWMFSDPNQFIITSLNAIELDPSGKVIVAGTARGNDGAPDILTARFHPDGNLDTSFYFTGFHLSYYGVGTVEAARSVMVQTDGKIIAAGEVDGNIAVLRLTADGYHDYSFGTMGWKTTQLGSFGTADAALGANGKIAIVAQSDPGGNFLTIRLNSDGSIDQNFNPGVSRTSGWIETNIGAQDQFAEDTAIQADGKIVVAFSSGYYGIRLLRYNADGSLDSSFGTNGRVGISSVCYNGLNYSLEMSTSVAIGSDGKILVGGYLLNACASGGVDFALFRVNSDGTLDTTFGTNGYALADFSSGLDYSTAIAIQEDGKIVLVGRTTPTNGGRTDFAVARFNSNGTLDTSFSTDGKTTIAFGNLDSYAHAVAVQSAHIGGKIVIAGYDTTLQMLQENHDFAIVRLNADGTGDVQFGNLGRVTTQFGSLNSGISDIVLLGPKIIAVGNARNTLGSDFAIAKYGSNGALDTTFDTDGKATTSFGSFNDSAFSVAVQTDGKLVVGGTGHSSSESKDNFALARYLANGSLDTTFHTDGKVTTSFSSFNVAADSVKALAIQADGKIVAAGSNFNGVNSNIAIARYTP